MRSAPQSRPCRPMLKQAHPPLTYSSPQVAGRRSETKISSFPSSCPSPLVRRDVTFLFALSFTLNSYMPVSWLQFLLKLSSLSAPAQAPTHLTLLLLPPLSSTASVQQGHEKQQQRQPISRGLRSANSVTALSFKTSFGYDELSLDLLRHSLLFWGFLSCYFLLLLTRLCDLFVLLTQGLQIDDHSVYS